VILSFDLAPTKCLARVDASGALVVEALPAWIEAMRTACFYTDTAAWNAASIGRVYKYMSKGFEACVPGVRRDLFTKISTHATKWDKGFYNLFTIEREILWRRDHPRYRRTPLPPPAGITPDDLRTVSRVLRFGSDYDSDQDSANKPCVSTSRARTCVCCAPRPPRPTPLPPLSPPPEERYAMRALANSMKFITRSFTRAVRVTVAATRACLPLGNVTSPSAYVRPPPADGGIPAGSAREWVIARLHARRAAVRHAYSPDLHKLYDKAKLPTFVLPPAILAASTPTPAAAPAPAPAAAPAPAPAADADVSAAGGAT
jgi:hypothetical protein